MNTCVCCGAPIPEGRQVCFICEKGSTVEPDAILEDGTPLYLKTAGFPPTGSIQLDLYAQLMGYKRAMEDK